jgi:hypothetical protein
VEALDLFDLAQAGVRGLDGARDLRAYVAVERAQGGRVEGDQRGDELLAVGDQASRAARWR